MSSFMALLSCDILFDTDRQLTF